VLYNKIKKYQHYIHKLLLLCGIAFPGLSKLVYTFIIEHRNSLEILGKYSTDMNVAVILSSLSAIGFSAVIMNRIPALGIEERKKTYTRICLQALCVNILLLPVLFILYKINFVYSFGYTFVFLVGLTSYQLYRQYLYSIADYLKVFMCEFTLLVVVSIGFLLFDKNLILVHGIIYIILGGGVFIFNFRRVKIFNKNEIKSGLGFGFANISTSVINDIAVPLSNQMLGVTYAGFVGFIKPIINFIVLIPRSMGTYYIPIMVRAKDNLQRKEIFKKFRSINNYFLTGVLALGILIWFIFIKIFPNSDLLLDNSTWLFMILIINLYSSQICYPYYSLFNAMDKSKVAFYFNFSMLICFCLSLLFITSFSGVKGYLIIYLTFTALLLIRYALIIKFVRYKNWFG
jgi:O-antigen/teichoic acid export membrane protein